MKRRIDRLVASGAIQGFTALIDPDVLGWQTEAYVELYCKGTVSPKDLRRSLEQVPEVVGAATVSRDAEALVHMLASDVKQRSGPSSASATSPTSTTPAASSSCPG